MKVCLIHRFTIIGENGGTGIHHEGNNLKSNRGMKTNHISMKPNKAK